MPNYVIFTLFLALPCAAAIPSLSDNHAALPGDTSSRADADINAADSDVGDSEPDYSRLVRLDLGFEHWISDRFRSAKMGKDLSFGIGINPGTPYLQLQGRFAYSTIRTVQGDSAFADYNGRSVYFANLGAALCTSFTKNLQSVMFSYSGGLVLVAIKGRPLTAGFSGGIGIDYLIRSPNWKNFSMGVSFSALAQVYNISGEKAEWKEWFSANKNRLDKDVNITLGYVIAFF